MIVGSIAILIMVLSAWMLQRDASGLTADRVVLADTPATITRPDGAPASAVVTVAHGYAGSRQMMRAFTRTLARSGMIVVSYDAAGHGRNARPMLGDLTRVEGATERLADEAVAVTRAALDRPDIDGPVAMLGHSMATDVMIRAARRVDAAAVVAVSMYSDAVTTDEPAHLLILSGATEGRLRDVALDAARLVDPDASEGTTARAEGVSRRAVAVPWVGHVGVLYAPEALGEAQTWIAGAFGLEPTGSPSLYGLWTGLLLAGTVALAWPLAGLAGGVRIMPGPLPRRTVRMAALLPIPLTLGAVWVIPDRVGGVLGFGPLAALMIVWGGTQAIILWRGGVRPTWPDWRGLSVLAGWGLLFALLLDRYGASFWPTGPRFWLLALLLPGAWLVMACDAALARRLSWPARFALRATLVVTMLACIILVPSMGVAFTVLPVMILFWLVHGMAAHWLLDRTNGAAIAANLGLWLAWAIAASTPLVAGAV